MIWYQEIANSDIDWIIEEIYSNLTKGQYIEKCIRSSLAKGNYYGIKAMDGDERVGFLTWKRGSRRWCRRKRCLTGTEC